MPSWGQAVYLLWWQSLTKTANQSFTASEWNVLFSPQLHTFDVKNLRSRNTQVGGEMWSW